MNDSTSDIVKVGYLRKLKGRKKYFVLRKETDINKPARLEYYTNLKKFELGQPPRKTIVLKACFNISRTDSKCRFAIALHTNNDCFRIAMNSEEEMNEWLRQMNLLLGDEDGGDDEEPSKPHFEHIWVVQVLNKGIASKENIVGHYRLCLTSKEVTLLKIGDHEGKNAEVQFPLQVIRNVSHDAKFGSFFHIELGRSAVTGPGLLSLKTEDHNIAQNMHLLILKAMESPSKDDMLPRGRKRTQTWNSDSSRVGSFHNTPPGVNRMPSIDGTCRVRTDSMSSSVERRINPKTSSVPIVAPNSLTFNAFYSTGTDSASSSYSVECENSLHNDSSHASYLNGIMHDHSHPEYVPFNPGDDHSSLTFSTTHDENNDYVETNISSKGGNGSVVQTPSPFDTATEPYILMSPGNNSEIYGVMKPTNKLSESHSRNSSIVEEYEGYVPMIPGAPGHTGQTESAACSNAGSTTALDDAYLGMDFSRKMNLSNDDVRKMSPASTESLQSGTPSSDFQLEKVSSYFSVEDNEDSSVRPLRAYSVGSRSDTSNGKGRYCKNRLVSVQENCRIRAMSVGSKSVKRPSGQLSRNYPNPLNSLSSVSVCGQNDTPMSSSWSGSTGRWLASRQGGNITSGLFTSSGNGSISNNAKDGAEADLMEMDFSHNKKNRKRSLPGPNGGWPNNMFHPPSSIARISPSALTHQNTVGGETPETPEMPKPFAKVAPVSDHMNNIESSKYASSSPISIQNGYRGHSLDSGSSIIKHAGGVEPMKVIEAEEEGEYFSMEFKPPPNPSSRIIQSRKVLSPSAYNENGSYSSLTSILSKAPITQTLNNTTANKTNVIDSCSVKPAGISCKGGASVSLGTSNCATNIPLDRINASLLLPRSQSASSNICNNKSYTTTGNNNNNNNNYNNVLSCNSVNTNSTTSSLGCVINAKFLRNNSLTSNGQNSSLTVSTVSPSSALSSTSPTSPVLSPNGSMSLELTRIEESPEKQDSMKCTSPGKIDALNEKKINYASIDHMTPHKKSGTGMTDTSPNASPVPPTESVTYSQIDFLKPCVDQSS